MLSTERARQIAKDWMASWNRRDLDSILSHYLDDVEFTSPFVVSLMGESSGTIKGKEKLREYFGK
jgi:ketosteroid isomerase-like protein